MNIIAVDDEQSQLNILTRAINEAMPDAAVYSFTRQSEMLAELSQNLFIPDVCFLDIEMPGKTGLELAVTLKQMYPKVNIIFVTGFSKYAIDAINLRSSGYILKPATCDKILAELGNLRTPPPVSEKKRNTRSMFRDI